MWVLWCTKTLLVSQKVLSHLLHWNGFSPVCVFSYGYFSFDSVRRLCNIWCIGLASPLREFYNGCSFCTIICYTTRVSFHIYTCIPCIAALYHIKVAQSISVCISQLGACMSYNFTSDVLAVDDVVSIQSDSSKE